MRYQIRSDNKIPLTLLENDRAMAILRNIALLISTKRGTCPMYRDYGLPMEWVHRPLIAAEAMIRAELTEAIEKYEPRAQLIDISLDYDPGDYGKYELMVEVEI